MKKGTIIGIVLVLLFGLGLMWWGSGGQSSVVPGSKTKSSLTASETFYDFGSISMARGKVDRVFKIANSTDKDIEVKKIVTSCMCTNAYLSGPGGEKGPFGMEGHSYVPPVNETIKAGESRDLKVVFDPNAHGPAGVGPIDRLVSLTASDGGALQFEIKAEVTP